MSYHYRKNKHRDDFREVYESPQDKLKTSIIAFGEAVSTQPLKPSHNQDALREIPRIVDQITALVPHDNQATAEALRFAITEQPYKIPYYAALVRQLHEPEFEAILGRPILEELWKGFQTYLDTLSWRETRLCIHFFAHLTLAKVITANSMFALLQSFTVVLEEFGVGHGRAKRAALCAAEGLMIAGPALKRENAGNPSEIIDAIQAYAESIASQQWLVQPLVKMFSSEITQEISDELLDAVLVTLRAFSVGDFEATKDSFVTPYENLTPLETPFELPSILVPPEVIELDGLSTDAGEDAQVKKEEWPQYHMRLFDNDVTPDPTTPAGYAVRTAIWDIIDIFEVNRKECARLLLEFPKWTVPGTFRPKPGSGVPEELVPGKSWQLESTIIETILGAYLVLPESSHKSIYYSALITELCKASPSTVGPAVGKSIRKLYGLLAEGLDVELGRRFAEWFAVHMSNFGFQWVWKEWVSDLELANDHPRRTFIRRAIEFEIRLAYHDRIQKTLPPPMQGPEALCISQHAPGPDFLYDDPENQHHDAAQSVLNLFRSRAKAEDVLIHLDALRASLESVETVINVDATIRSIAVQSLMHIGSRSFSHFLNAIERYLPLLRNLAAAGAPDGTGNAEAKADILTAAASFWNRNPQMTTIVFDKLMQYQIVDPHDVVAWTFANRVGITEVSANASSKGPGKLSAFEWDLLKGALDKANGRVMIARRRVAFLRKKEDEDMGRVKAKADAMDVDSETKQETIDNPSLDTALKAFASLTREQKAALSRTLDGFVGILVLPAADGTKVVDVVSESAWEKHGDWTSEEWNAWETWGWYRQFCRVYSPYLRNYAKTLGTVSFAKIEGSAEASAVLLKKTWNIATGQD